MKKIILLGITAGLSLISCAPDSESVQIGTIVGSLPMTPIYPTGNEYSAEKVELGRLLFWDPILSGNKDVACATCHHPNNAYTDNIEISIGVQGTGLSKNRQPGSFAERNSPTIINSGFIGIEADKIDYDPLDTAVFWDSRAESLEEQVLGPIDSHTEMRGDVFAEGEAVTAVIARLNKIQEYKAKFNEVFGTSEITSDLLTKAIATFERSVTATNSRFDQYSRGDSGALTAEEIRGLQAFNESKCNGCHSGPMFSDFELHNLDPGNSSVNPNDDGAGDNKFRTPSLRNVALTSPYMHAGNRTTLEDVVNFYNRLGPNRDPNDEKLNALDFDSDESADLIVAFLQTLTDTDFDKTIPATVPSGLNPGGYINKR